MHRLLAALALTLGVPAAWAVPTDVPPDVLKIARDVHTSPGDLPRLEVSLDGKTRPLPLRHTHVFAELTTHIARVDVMQTYRNDFDRAIEAVYVFPLPENAAVDDMKIEVGGRVIVAEIQKKAEAKATYDAARRAGHTAALLEQERPNIFTQSVANIPPGEEVKVMVRFVQHLSYDAGEYEWVFPMVVGPRFIPGSAVSARGTGWSPDTDAVPDASRITPPIVGEGLRTGHDISLEVVVDSALPIVDLQTPTHAVDAWTQEDGILNLALTDAERLPNRDFVLRYRVDGAQPQVAVQAHRTRDLGHFALTVQPPRLDVDQLVGRRELIFVVDVSGSMSGLPIQLAKEAARLAIGQMRPVDTFNVYTFAGHTARAFERSRPANEANIRTALDFVHGARAGGGTRLDKAVDEALGAPAQAGRHRYVVFLTDGFIGNEAATFAKARDMIARNARGGQRARVFALGTGSSVNRHLITGLGEAGEGLGLTVTLAEDPAKAVRRIYRLIDSPVLRDVVIDWGDLAVKDVYPAILPDVLASRPLQVYGRYEDGGSDTVTIRGVGPDGPVSFEVAVELPAKAPKRAALASLWAREKVSELSKALWDGHDQPAVDAITETGLAYRLVTAYTSFVAVDRSRTVSDGAPAKVVQPAEAPAGVDVELAAPAAAMGSLTGTAFGDVSGVGGLGLSGFGAGAGGGGIGVGTIGVGTRGVSGRVAVGYGRGAARLSGRKARAPRVIPGKVIVQGSLDKEIIRRVIRRHRAEYRYCYEKQLIKDPELAGKIVMKFTLDARGKVVAVEVASDTLKDPAVGTCMLAKIKRWRFPSVKGGGVVVINYPFVFKPR